MLMAEDFRSSQIALKLLAFATVLICLCVLALTRPNNQTISTKSSNITIKWGFKTQSDVLLARHVTIKPKSWFSSKTTNVTWRYPVSGQLGRNITAIYFYEAPRSRANLELLSGGVGRKYANIRLTPQHEYGLNVTIEVYGRTPRENKTSNARKNIDIPNRNRTVTKLESERKSVPRSGTQINK
uniref:(northern house mosquito) hypothetical protein n=1 Tax=Culex pipiens TaxID=7175 RepID=A0A8D8NZX4_CULPI